jgi:predicted Holliday junction resolvase-like endonuclease
MPIWIAMVIGLGIGVILTYALLSNLRNGKIQAEYEVQISELKRKHQKELRLAQSRSVNSSRAILKGRMAEQFAPIFLNLNICPAMPNFWEIQSTISYLMVITPFAMEMGVPMKLKSC